MTAIFVRIVNSFGRHANSECPYFGIYKIKTLMHFIWYNPDLGEYKYGNVAAFNTEIKEAQYPKAYTVLMEFDRDSEDLANKIIRQLNIANLQSIVRIAS